MRLMAHVPSSALVQPTMIVTAPNTAATMALAKVKKNTCQCDVKYSCSYLCYVTHLCVCVDCKECRYYTSYNGNDAIDGSCPECPCAVHNDCDDSQYCGGNGCDGKKKSTCQCNVKYSCSYLVLCHPSVLCVACSECPDNDDAIDGSCPECPFNIFENPVFVPLVLIILFCTVGIIVLFVYKVGLEKVTHPVVDCLHANLKNTKRKLINGLVLFAFVFTIIWIWVSTVLKNYLLLINSSQ